MRKFILMVFFFLFAVSAFAQAGKDGITEVWDFGSVKAGETPKHEFVLKNDTAKPFNIVNVNTSCGCTSSGVKKTHLVQGESTTIEVKFNSKGYNGNVKQYVYVSTDSLDKAFVTFIIKANVIK